METLRLSQYEIEAKFTKSELGIMSWNSHESYARMMKKSKPIAKSEPMPVETEVEGDNPDLSKMTSAEALRFLRGQGLLFPTMLV